MHQIKEPEIPFELRQESVDVLVSLPNIHDMKVAQALISSAGFDAQLLGTIEFSGAPQPFFQTLVSLLSSYGTLEDGRHALAALLRSAKEYVGQEKRVRCDRLIQAIRDLAEQGIAGIPAGAEIGKNSAEINPFGAVGRIEAPEHFFDREELLRQIFEELDKGCNLSLVGESRIGKSSLLAMIGKSGAQRMRRPPDLFAYMSMEWVDDENDFYETLCEELQIECCRGGKLRRALKGSRRILCLDEIEKMTWNGFTERVRSHLRGLADGANAPLRLVIASRSPLDHLFPDSPGMTSPLAGICHKIDVKPFPKQIARQFLLQRLKGMGIHFTETQIQDLISQTEGHPAKLQEEAAKLFRELTKT